jgi:hypothetical protein
LTICSLRIRWSKNHTSRRKENPGHARHPAPQQFRFNQLWKWYESCTYLKADDSIDRAREVFANDLGKRIFAALVMEHGKPKEKPINLITPWDLMKGKLSARP